MAQVRTCGPRHLRAFAHKSLNSLSLSYHTLQPSNLHQ
uniref:Uncharacterized protein n=1 Tax=Arundo donax TaxID=35708 RepID=A0A0A9GA21_ARUDO